MPAIYRIVNKKNRQHKKSQIERFPFFSQRSKNNLPEISISSRYITVENISISYEIHFLRVWQFPRLLDYYIYRERYFDE